MSKRHGFVPSEPPPVVEEEGDLGEEPGGHEELAEEETAFEREYNDDHSWEDLQEDEHGRLRALDPRAAQRAKRRRLQTDALSQHIRRGLIRYLEVIVDMSRAAAITDFRPNRFAIVSGVLRAFIREFFDQNPLSHLGILLLRDGVAERLTDLSGSPEAHIARLARAGEAAGDVSLQNGLDAAVASLRSIPPYGHREALVLLSALSTCDPGNIREAIGAARQHRVRVSVVGLAAQVHICQTITQETGGTYGVALDEHHLEGLVEAHAAPPPTPASATAASMVPMGFPQRAAEGAAGQAFVGADALLHAGGFTCPRCKARVQELPGGCHVCGLTLVSSPHLARSYHHLFPVRPFREVPPKELAQLAQRCFEISDGLRVFWPPVVKEAAAQGSSGTAGPGSGGLTCHACCCLLTATAASEDAGGRSGSGDEGEPGVVLRCPECQLMFCFDCDLYIHESLHVCPGCEAAPLDSVDAMNQD